MKKMIYKKNSVLVPTRKRLNFLSKMLESFEATVSDPEQAEIIFRCDRDDRETIEYLCHTPHKIIVGPRQEGYKNLPAFFNEMASIAKGDLLMCCNDDVLFMTPNWPALILDEAAKYPDGIFNLGVNVGINDDLFPFSIVSRKLVNILGFINDERLLCSDIFLRDVARHFNRTIRIDSVTVLHDWAGRVADETRADAGKHAATIVGDWSEYGKLHELAVNESINKIIAAHVI